MRKGCRLKGYLSVQQTAEKWGVSVRWVNQYILDGRIPGCERFGHVWAVPEDAVKPKRLTPGVKAKLECRETRIDIDRRLKKEGAV